MPKFFCDYCDVYLTHDSMSVRKAHNTGRNHLRNVVEYYQQIGHEKAQSVIDSITSSYAAEGQANPMLQQAPGFPPPPPGFPGLPAGMPPPFAMPGGQNMPPMPPLGASGMPPFPPFGLNGQPPPKLPNGMPFPPPGQMPGNFPFPPPGAPGGFGMPGQQGPPGGQGNPSPGPGQQPGHSQGPQGFNMAPPPPGLNDNRR